MFVNTLVVPFAAKAQVAPAAVWQGAPRPPHAQPAYPQPYAQPAYPEAYAQPTYPAYAQPAYPPAYHRSGYRAPASYPSGVPAPAVYAYTVHPAYPAYPASYYGPSYAQASQVAAGSWSAPHAEAPVRAVTTKDNLHHIEMGLGAFIPTDGGNPAKLGLEANVWAAHAGWVPNSGFYLALDASTGFDIGCLARRADDGCKGHLRIHWIGAGPFFNTGTPMIARDVPRSWDLLAMTGAEVRLWKGLTAKATLNWFLPSPWGVYAHAKQLTEASVSATKETVTPGTAVARAEAANPTQAVGDILGHALQHPQLNLLAMWEF
jgi:hypothetical protein